MQDKSDDFWKQKLTPQQYEVLRHKGTEAPFSGDLLTEKRAGIFQCSGCGADVFSSSTKYDSTLPGLMGWPSFSQSLSNDVIILLRDNSYGMNRVEVVCAHCHSHLGHIFDDPSSETGQHYCINSVSLNFKPAPKKE
ncbi:MAG: peptide-methionine (R)-S-oxide reductase MsrB [Candidatus Saccharimonadales bacterium]